MTAAQLAHLAGLAADAAGFYATTDPAAARVFEDTALRASTLAAELGLEELWASCRAELGIAAARDRRWSRAVNGGPVHVVASSSASGAQGE